MRLRLILLAAALLPVTPVAFAQAQRGTLVHEETIRVSPSADTAKLGEAGRGHELIIIETSRDWTHVEAILREPRKDADEDDPGPKVRPSPDGSTAKPSSVGARPAAPRLFSARPPTPKTTASHHHGRHDTTQDAIRFAASAYFVFGFERGGGGGGGLGSSSC